MTEPTPTEKKPVVTPPPLSRNMVSYAGWAVTITAASLFAVLLVAELFVVTQNPYDGLVTYILLPGVAVGGVALILLGILLEWRRRHGRDPGNYPTLPTVDLNLKWQRRRILIGISCFAIFFGGSAVGTYEAYHFTESPEFCGLLCHKVMSPEYTAYQHSPHSNVACTECHIGSGAKWFVKYKLTGMRQLYQVVTNTYHLPINTPVLNMRPANDTCGACHSAAMFKGTKVKEIWHFAPDQANTPVRYNLLMKVGGGSSADGQGHGIHWHSNPDVQVRYWASDEDRLDIPWVEVSVAGGAPRIFRSKEAPKAEPPAEEIRIMDCIDCHNRPTHIYKSPRDIVDFSLANGQLDTSLPYARRYAAEVLEKSYANTPEAVSNIKSEFEGHYSERMEGVKGKKAVEAGAAWLQTEYQGNIFPEQGANWRQYPDHSSHFEFPGCFRCHDGAHTDEKGVTISNSCNLCHDMIDQAEGEAAYKPATYHSAPFMHPRNLGDIWIGRKCTDCHGVKVEAHNKGEDGEGTKGGG